MDTIKCDWCKEETSDWIVGFGNTKICKEKDPGPREGDLRRFKSECWLRGTKLNHTVRY